MSVGLQRLGVPIKHAVRSVCSSKKTYKCKLLVVGAGAGGCSVAWRLSNTLKNGIMVLEPSNAKESTLAFYMKKDLFPFIYWNFMLKGYYHGPEMVRKIVNPFGL